MMENYSGKERQYAAHSGEFQELASTLAGRIRGAFAGRLRPAEIGKLVEDTVGICNCYPGTPTDDCYSLAFFFSLSSKIHGRGHNNFVTTIELFMRHMKGNCSDQTKTVVIITDTWDPAVLHQRSVPFAAAVSRCANVEIYLVSGGEAFRLPI